MARRTARLRFAITPSLLEGLGLPEGTRVLAIETSQDPVGFVLVLEHPGLPEVPDDAESPGLMPQVGDDGETVSFLLPGGKTWPPVDEALERVRVAHTCRSCGHLHGQHRSSRALVLRLDESTACFQCSCSEYDGPSKQMRAQS